MLLIPENSSSQSETRKRIMPLKSTRITCRSETQLIQNKESFKRESSEFKKREREGREGFQGRIAAGSRQQLRACRLEGNRGREESTGSKVPG